jgi:hypothetical protein
MEGKTGRVCSSISRLVSRWKRNFILTCWCWWGNSPRGKKTFEKSARGRENNKNLKIQKRRTGKFEIPTTTRNLVGRANFPQIEEDGYYKYQTRLV